MRAPSTLPSAATAAAEVAAAAGGTGVEYRGLRPCAAPGHALATSEPWKSYTYATSGSIWQLQVRTIH